MRCARSLDCLIVFIDVHVIERIAYQVLPVILHKPKGELKLISFYHCSPKTPFGHFLKLS